MRLLNLDGSVFAAVSVEEEDRVCASTQPSAGGSPVTNHPLGLCAPDVDPDTMDIPEHIAQSLHPQELAHALPREYQARITVMDKR
jgi:predicted Ser/Thr protein kinase